MGAEVFHALAKLLTAATPSPTTAPVTGSSFFPTPSTFPPTSCIFSPAAAICCADTLPKFFISLVRFFRLFSVVEISRTRRASGEDLERLRKKAREMGEQTKFSASEAAEAMNYMAMAGWKTEDMLNGIEGIMSLAAASGENLGSVSDIVPLSNLSLQPLP